MADRTLATVGAQIREQAAAFCAASEVPGYVAGVYHDGGEAVVAHGVANMATGAPMREDTLFLLGSITKVMTTTLVLQQVERGTVDLDAPVVRYLPDFRLTAPGAAERILVRHLLTHTNGIDADMFFPAGRGAGALQAFVDGLGRHCGALFPPDAYVSYSNGGMIVAGRLLEVVTGVGYHDLLRRDTFAPVGMADACTSAEEAILRSTAVGHFPGGRRTDMFMLPETWAPAGSTPIGSVRDLLALGRTHLGGGVSPAGRRVLSAESAARMREVTHDMGTPLIPPLGMGWLLLAFGDVTVLAFSGASAGGNAVLAVVPGPDLVFAAYGNDGRAMALHDRILLWLLRERLEVEVPELVGAADPAADLACYAGTYRSNQLRLDVRVADGQLEETMTYEPLDEAQARIFNAFAGGGYPVPPRRLVPIGGDLFAPAGMPPQAFAGYARQLLVSYHGVGGRGPAYHRAGGRMMRRQT